MSRRDEEFTAYVVARRAHLYRTAYLLSGGDSHRAEDVVQQALTRLYAAWSRVSRADSVDAYARRAVVNAHIDDTRRPPEIVLGGPQNQWTLDCSVDQVCRKVTVGGLDANVVEVDGTTNAVVPACGRQLLGRLGRRALRRRRRRPAAGHRRHLDDLVAAATD